MQVKVDGIGLIHNLDEKDGNEKLRLFKSWHQKFEILCLCNGLKGDAPALHVVRSKNGNYFLRNNRSNRENGLIHAFTCPYNQSGYRSLIKKQGISISEEGYISCSIGEPKNREDKKHKQEGVSLGGGKKSQSTKSSVTSLRWLFLTLIKERHIDIYRPNGKRDIAGRLFNVASMVKNKRKLLEGRVYVAREGVELNFGKHQLIIAWGYKDSHQPHPNNDNLVRLPIYSIANPDQQIKEISVLKRVIRKATYSRASVETGYWVIWKEPDKTGKLIDQQIIFVPAERQTMIPVDSSYEEKMLQYLVKKNRYFRKPVVGNVTELFLDLRPDIVLYDTNPFTIIEVAGLKENKRYRKRLAEKRKAYEQRGYRYVEWDGVVNIKDLGI